MIGESLFTSKGDLIAENARLRESFEVQLKINTALLEKIEFLKRCVTELEADR